jgi:prepilin-type N-terminal cleavage/methylation domain-containing protein/prepilin-type processing-associated H-X9-DG protein
LVIGTVGRERDIKPEWRDGGGGPSGGCSRPARTTYMTRPNGYSPGGFSLIELLIVVGIVGLLMAMLLPALARARDQDRSTACLSNLRVLGAALSAYATDDATDRFPLFDDWLTGERTSGYWFLTLHEGAYAQAADDMQNAFVCPSGRDEDADEHGGHMTAPAGPRNAHGARYYAGRNADGIRFRTNYAMSTHGWIDLNQAPRGWYFTSVYPSFILKEDTTLEEAQGRRVSQIRYPAELLLLYDGLWTTSLTASRYSHRHNRWSAGNVLLVDGHSVVVPNTSMPDWEGDSDWNPPHTSNPTRYGFRIWDEASSPW